MVGTCEVAKMPEYFVDAPMPAAHEKHSKPGPLKLVLPPKPRQRPIGTSASNSISSEILASSSVLGQLISNTRSMVEMAQPRSRLVPNVPSLSARSLNTGLLARRSSSMRLSEAILVLPFFYSLHAERSCRKRSVGWAEAAAPFRSCFSDQRAEAHAVSSSVHDAWASLRSAHATAFPGPTIAPPCRR